MKKFIFILPLLFAVVLSSCLGSSDENQGVLYARQCCNRIISTNAAQLIYVASQVDYNMNYVNSTVVFTIYDFDFGNGVVSDITLPEMLYTQTASGFTFSMNPYASSVVKVGNSQSSDLLLDSFDGVWQISGTSTYSAEFFQLNFTLNSLTATYNVQSNMVTYGYPYCATTVFATDSTSSNLTQKDGNVTIGLDLKNNTAKILFDGMKLTQTMDGIVNSWLIDGVSVAPTTTGFTLSSTPGKEIKPTSDGYDVHHYVITNLTGYIDISNRHAQIQFYCSGEKVTCMLYMENPF